jgi:hypothetical protein
VTGTYRSPNTIEVSIAPEPYIGSSMCLFTPTT